MEVEQYTNQSTMNPQGLMSRLNKKRILILIGIVGFVLLIIVSLVLSGSNKKNVQTDQKTAAGEEDTMDSKNNEKSNSGSKVVIQVSPTVNYLPAEEVAKGFYMWYVSHPNPLASGDYKERPDITDEYKAIMARYVSRGLSKTRDDVFNCGDSKLPANVTFYKTEEDLFLKQVLVTIQEVASRRNLFQIKLQKSSETWLIRDVWCAP